MIEQVPGLTFGSDRGRGRSARSRFRSACAARRSTSSTAFRASSCRRCARSAASPTSRTASRSRSPSCACDVDRQRASDLGIPAWRHRAPRCRRRSSGEVATTIEDAAGDNHDVRVRLRPDQRRFAEDLLALHGAHGQRRRQQGQDSDAAQRSGGRACPGTGPSIDPPPGPGQREVRVSANTDGRPLQEVSERHRGRRRAARPAARLRHRAGRRHRGAGEHVQEHVPGAVPGGGLHLPDPGVAVRLVHAPAGDHAVAAAVAGGRGGAAVLRPTTR